MNEKQVEDMSYEELVAEISAIRDRRAKARERRDVAPSAPKIGKTPQATEITGDLGQALDDLLSDE